MCDSCLIDLLRTIAVELLESDRVSYKTFHELTSTLEEYNDTDEDEEEPCTTPPGVN